MSGKLSILIAGLFATGLIAAGCGGDDDDGGGDGGGGGGEPLTKAEFTAEAKQICADHRDDAQAAFADAQQEATDNPGEATEIIANAFADDVVPIIRDMVGQIDDLTPPAELEEAHDNFVTSADDAFDEIEDDPQKIIEQTAAGESPYPELEKATDELGLTDCLEATGGSSGGSGS